MKKMVLQIVQEKPQLKFESNFRDNRCHGRTTDDVRRTNFDFMSSADIVKQS